MYGTGNGLVVTHVEPEGSGADLRVEVMWSALLPSINDVLFLAPHVRSLVALTSFHRLAPDHPQVGDNVIELNGVEVPQLFALLPSCPFSLTLFIAL